MAEGSQRPAGAAELALPDNLAKYAPLRDRTRWIETVPAVLEAARERLELDWVGEPFQPGGQTAWVAPVHDRARGRRVARAARHRPPGRPELNRSVFTERAGSS